MNSVSLELPSRRRRQGLFEPDFCFIQKFDVCGNGILGPVSPGHRREYS